MKTVKFNNVEFRGYCEDDDELAIKTFLGEINKDDIYDYIKNDVNALVQGRSNSTLSYHINDNYPDSLVFQCGVHKIELLKSTVKGYSIQLDQRMFDRLQTYPQLFKRIVPIIEHLSDGKIEIDKRLVKGSGIKKEFYINNKPWSDYNSNIVQFKIINKNVADRVKHSLQSKVEEESNNKKTLRYKTIEAMVMESVMAKLLLMKINIEKMSINDIEKIENKKFNVEVKLVQN